MSDDVDAAAPGAALTKGAAVGPITPLGALAVTIAGALGEQLFSSWDRRSDGTPVQLVPRFGRTQNPRVDGGHVRVGVLAVTRLSDQADWTARVMLGTAEHVVALPRSLSHEDAAVEAWRNITLAAASIGLEG